MNVFRSYVSGVKYITIIFLNYFYCFEFKLFYGNTNLLQTNKIKNAICEGFHC